MSTGTRETLEFNRGARGRPRGVICPRVMDHEATLRRPAELRRVHRATLRVDRGPEQGRVLVVEERSTLAVGTAADNDLVLRDPSVSRYHLELSFDDHGARLRDLGSSNGTWVAGLRVNDAIVPTPCAIELGETRLVLSAEELAVPDLDGAPDLPGIVGESPRLVELKRAVERLALSELPVLVNGETGTGKELVARALHERGPRKSRAFETVDCGALPPNLIASELFGHERGAFTGADRKRTGAFERAHGGTLFLDEVGELPLELQPSLLGVLERGRFRRVGGDIEIEVDVRVVSATHRDLRSEVNRGAFRADLYYRLAVARLVLPPLRERPEDLPALVAHFTALVTGDPRRSPFGPREFERLATQHWPGNVRELRNVVEAALALGGLELDAPTASQRGGSPEAPRPPDSSDPLPSYRDARAAALADFEKHYLRRLIDGAAGNASEAARRAQMDRPYLLGLLKKHGLR
jgi:DNA-binding NtrC family response regulator